MSWSFSRALVEEYSDQCCSDTELSAPLSTTPMPDQFYWPDKTTEHSRLSRFGMTCVPLTASHGEALLMWFLEDSRARKSALPETGPDWTAKGLGYGEKWRGLLGRFDPATCELKTAQCSFIEDLSASSPTLPQWGLMLDGELYQQPIPALCTGESESGYWPTPTVCGNYNRPGASATSGMGLASAVRMWPTPCASASKGSSPASLVRKSGRDRSNDRLDHAVMASEGGPLNPDWVEWLMGWPIGHTDLKPLETDKFQEWQQQHGGSFTDSPETPKI
jgi:hypothetical protein